MRHSGQFEPGTATGASGRSTTITGIGPAAVYVTSGVLSQAFGSVLRPYEVG